MDVGGRMAQKKTTTKKRIVQSEIVNINNYREHASYKASEITDDPGSVET